MNIIKEFEDEIFLCKLKPIWSEISNTDKWYWALGDDGKLYWKCTYFKNIDYCSFYTCSSSIMKTFSLREISLIAQNFSNLLPLL